MGSGWRRVVDRTHLLATPAGPQPALLIPGTGAGRVPRKETGSWEWGIPRGQAAGPGSESTGSPRLVRLIDLESIGGGVSTPQQEKSAGDPFAI